MEDPVAKAAKKKASAAEGGTEAEGTKKKATRAKKKTAEAGSRGLAASEIAAPGAEAELERKVVEDGGEVLASYRDPLGGHVTLMAALPIERVEPTPFQRDLSATHVKRLGEVIDKLDWFLDPLVVVRSDDGKYLTPNGNHRLNAMKNLGAKSIVALLVPRYEIAYKILALNTEKAHNLREKALEVIRMARSLAELDPRPEQEFEMEFEEPSLITLGACYEQRPRISGGAYNPVLKRVDAFLPDALPAALEIRAARAQQVLELDDAVTAAVERCKAKGLESPYLRTFVVARVNPLRFSKSPTADFDETLAKMTASATAFDPGKVSADQLATAGGAPDE
jgi:ParB family chromosome partitioning protein